MSRQSVLSSVASRAVSRAVTSLLLPGLFVFLWSTGFIGSKVVMQYAPPLTFLALRFALAAIVLAPFLFILKTQWPTRFLDYVHSAIVGALVHAIYLGGVFWAISLGTGAGLSSLIVGLQPLLTLCLSVALLGERAGKLKIAGVLTGLVGFAVVIAGRTTINELSLDGLMLCGAALIAISAGSCCPVFSFNTSALSLSHYRRHYCSNQLKLSGTQNSCSLPPGWYWCYRWVRYFY